MKRIVVCGEGFAFFGIFIDWEEAKFFMDIHEKWCRRPHFIRKLTDPSLGVVNDE